MDPSPKARRDLPSGNRREDMNEDSAHADVGCTPLHPGRLALFPQYVASAIRPGPGWQSHEKGGADV